MVVARQRQELHEVDLVGIDIEGDVGPELEIDPQPLPVLWQMRDLRQILLVHALGAVGRGLLAQIAPHLVDPFARLDAVAAAEQPRQSRMRDIDVQRIGIIVGDLLPVHIARTQRDAAERHQLLHTVGGDLVLVRRHHLGDRRAVAGKAHEDEAVIDLVLDRLEAALGRIEPHEGVAERNAGELAARS